MLSIPGYQSIEKIGETTGSLRYRAVRVEGDLPVLLKLLRGDRMRLADVARLKHDYARIARIDSARVVKVHAVEEHAAGILLVLEAPRGRELGERLAAEGRLEVGQFLDLAIAMAEALRDVHQHDVVHGAIKPSSFLLDEGGGVRLSNYGVEAAATHEDDALYSHAVLTQTLPYISPEQTGRMNRGVDHRADLYSLGVVFHEMLVGKRPFEAEDPLELIHAHLAVLPEPPSRIEPSVPLALGDVLLKLLCKDAEGRYQSAGGLVADLEECRALFRRHGRIEGFTAGQRDRAALFQIHQKLYGREDDTRRLIGAFDDVLGGALKIVMVSGYSGIGKSSLVQEILKPLAREKGYYISGKYDQYNRDKPYSAVIQAFEMLVRQILTESEARIEGWRAGALHALGSNAQVICDLIPSLRHLIGDPPPVPGLAPLEAQNRVNLTFQRFVSVFARHAHPLALFLDDLQWIDAASLSLMKSLLAGEPLESFFFCGAYRDNEVSPAHPVILAISELRSERLLVEDIVLSPLRLPHIIALVKDSLGRSDAGALCELVLKKTGGNPFFIKRLMSSLHGSGALSLDGAGGFTWNLEAIEALDYTSNVVDLMVSAIRRMPAETQRSMTLASAIGNRFDLGTLSTVGQRSAEDVYGRLEPAVREGLLTTDGASYRFAHDKIQEAAYSMIPEGERAAFHYRIGTLLSSRRDRAPGQDLFDIVNHLNAAGDLVQAPEERLLLARMDLEAAEKAEESAAFEAALKYLVSGIELLPEGSWDAEYDLTFALSTKKGTMESLVGRHDDGLATLACALQRARDRTDQTKVRKLKINVQVLKNDLLGALSEGFAALRAFGLDLESYCGDHAVRAELSLTLHLVAGRSVDALCDLPLLSDPDIAVLQDLLQELFVPCYFTAPNLCEVTVMKLVQNTLHYGIARSSAYAYVNFGMFLCARSEIEMGYQFGQAAMRLSQRYPDKSSESTLLNMLGCSVQHWKEGYARYRETLLAGVHVGLETGQYIWAFYNAVNTNTNSLLSGRPLGEVLAEARSFLPLMRLDRWNTITWMIGAAAQISHNLMSPVAEPAKLTGEWVDIEAVLEESRRIKSHASVFFAHFYVLFLAVFQGDYAEAARRAEETDPTVMGIASWHGTPCFHFYLAIAVAQAAPAADPEARGVALAKARAACKKMAYWASCCPENYRHRYLLLSGEVARLEGDVGAAADRYEEAILAARESHCLQDEALASELCANHYLHLKRPVLALAYLTRAHAVYGRWGATEITARLERAHPGLLQQAALYARLGPAPEGLSEAPARDDLDLRSVLDASQAISGEIVLPRLLEKLMRIILENAGARRGFLILKDETRLTIEAEGDVEGGRVEILRSIPLESRDDLSVNVVHYVGRTKESVVIGDAASEPWLASDPYVRAKRPKSIVVAPILHQGRTLGVIYLENNLAPFAFTTKRVEILGLLSSQIALSIENARLFSRLEEKVEARTTDLRAATEQISMLHAVREREQEEQLKEKLALIERQRELIHALSTPIIQVWDDVLTLPVVGILDKERAADITQGVLAAVVRTRARFAIIDLTGVERVDAASADHLLRIVRAVELIGARGIITGIQPVVAQTMMSLDVDMQRITTHATLREGLKVCMGALASRRI